MSYKDLLKLVAPPSAPVEAGPASRRAKVETALKTKLPDFYIEYALAYGSGLFQGGAIGSFQIYNPLAIKYVKFIKDQLKSARQYREEEGEEEFEYKVYPKKPGILPLGSNDAYAIYYLVEDGDPEKWPIVARAHDGASFERYDLSLPDFLVQLFEAEKPSPPWPSKRPRKGKPLSFSPSALKWDEPRNYRTLFDLYQENGNRAGFWALYDVLADQGGIWYVSQVMGKRVGSISVGAMDDDATAANVDIYKAKELASENLECPYSMAAQKLFWIAPAPEWYQPK